MSQALNKIGEFIAPITQIKLSLKIKPISAHLLECSVEVPNEIIKDVANRTVQLFAEHAAPLGLENAPASYLETYYKNEIDENVKLFIYKYFVIDFLNKELNDKKIIVAHVPRLKGVTGNSDHFSYHFALSILGPIEIREWKNFAFRAPKRKNYKDLDKQVEHFLKLQQDVSKNKTLNSVEDNDWVHFKTKLTSRNETSDDSKCENSFWVKISTETVVHPLASLFLGKKVGDSFVTNALSLNEGGELASLSNLHYFKVTILSVTKGSFVIQDALKTAFKVSSKNALHDKLIEVFSYRSDISQRRAIIEETFHLLFAKHRFEIPRHLVLRKQEEILNNLRSKPDFQAYRIQDDFIDHVSALAEKQLKEEVLIDQIAQNEKWWPEERDIQNYLNMLSNERMKEFIYFRSFLDEVDECPAPINNSVMQQICKREKTLNGIIHQLMK